MSGPIWTGAFDAERIAAWMDGEGLESGPITDIEPLAGGTQNVLIKFKRGARGFVFRGPPPHVRANSNETMRREARLLAALAGSDVPHPAFIAGCPREDVIGCAFYLMAPVEGFNPRVKLATPYVQNASWRHAMGLEMVDAIAALARVDHVGVGLADFGKIDGYLERQVPRWRAWLDAYKEFPGWPGPDSIPGIERVADWLAANISSDFRPGLIHGDFHFGNVMFRADAPKLAAVVDWELATLGDPLVDLGNLLSGWPDESEPQTMLSLQPGDGFPTRSELIARYHEQTGRDVSSVDWFEVLACYKIGIILEGTFARACAGKAPKATGDQLHAHTLALFARANRKITSGGTQ